MTRRSSSGPLAGRSARVFAALVLAVTCLAADGPTAAQVAKLAREAEKAGLHVRAWQLYREASRLDPSNASYRTHRDALESNARLLSQFGLEKEDKSLDDLRKEAAAEQDLDGNDAEKVSGLDPFVPGLNLLPPPKLKRIEGIHSFDSRGDEKALYAVVARAFGFKVVFDPAFTTTSNLQFHAQDADLHDALEALTACTNTFLFPIDSETIFVARDDPQKRQVYEPQVTLTVLLPDAVDPKDVTDAANAVKGLMESQRIMVDASARSVLIRDYVSRAYIARSLFECLLLPRPQVSLEFQLLSLDDSSSYHYGIAFPTSYPIENFGKGKFFQRILPMPSGFTSYLAFGGGATLFGVAIENTDIFAISSKSWTRTLYDGSVTAGNGQAATLHVGDKYPIAQALSTGFSQGGSAQIVPQTTQEDLGIAVKATPHILSSGDVLLDLEVSYKTLGDSTFNSVPSINVREFKGSVHLSEGESAVIAGMESESLTVSRSGIIGLADIPGLNHVLAENTRQRMDSRSMIVLKPVITRPRTAETFAPQFAFGGEHGERVLL